MKVIANKYRLIKLIGSGAMGEVFLGEVIGSYGFVRRIAIKLLPREARKSSMFREAFIREATTLAGISHPNLVKVFDFGDDGDRLFLCMEFIRGFSLRELIRSTERWGERIPLEIVIKIAAEMVEGLHYIHGMGVIHGDLTPKNIMVGLQGEFKILDFGLSRFPSQLPSDVPLGGKVGFIAPEIELERKILPASDMYSLGAVILEMLGSKDDRETMRPGIGFDMHDELSGLAELCLNDAPGERPSAGEMLEKVKELKRRIDSGFEIKDYLNQVYNEEEYTFLISNESEQIKRPIKKTYIPAVFGMILFVVATVYLFSRNDFQANLSGKPVDQVGVKEGRGSGNLKQDNAALEEEVGHPQTNRTSVNLSNLYSISEENEGARSPLVSKDDETKDEVFTINSYPEKASVFFNGINLGETPIDMRLSTIVGDRENVLRVNLEGYEEKIMEVSAQEVADGGNVFVVLKRATGFLRVNVNPWAYVFVDGTKVGTTPIIDEVLTAGKHTILLTNDKLGVTLRKVIEVKDGETLVFIEDFYD